VDEVITLCIMQESQVQKKRSILIYSFLLVFFVDLII
jgi:hypothetical protein